MKVMVLLSLLGLVAANFNFALPYSSTPQATPTFGTVGNTPLISTYTASYPYSGVPSIQAVVPTTYRYPFLTSPFITTGNTPSTIVTSRQKRSADPEPEADPSLLYTTSPAFNYQWTLPTTIPNTIPATTNIGYTGLPSAVTTYSYPPQTIPTTGITYATPLTGFTNARSSPIISPYSAFPIWTPVVPATGALATPNAAETPKPVETRRTKRSADPEASSQTLATGFTGFTYPAINTRTNPNLITYTSLPATSTALTYSTPPAWPTTYTSGLPINYGTYPAGTTFIAGI